MKHILHKNVNGKIGKDGKTYFYVYITFTVDRISYRLKSQLVTRPITKDEYANLEDLYKGELSDLLHKERQILINSMEEIVAKGPFDRNQFREDYINYSRSLIDLVKKARSSSPISNWSAPAISWELTKNLDIEDETFLNSDGKIVNDEDLFELEVNLLEFQLAMRKNQDIQGLCLLYDWKKGSLKQEIGTYLKRQHSIVRANHLIQILQTVVEEI